MCAHILNSEELSSSAICLRLISQATLFSHGCHAFRCHFHNLFRTLEDEGHLTRCIYFACTCSKGDLGFSLPQSSISVNHLLYADDACIISNTPAGCQHLLDMVQRWLEWAHLKAKVPKCHSMVLHASSGKRMCTYATISGDTIPPAEDNTFKFLGMPVRVSSNNTTARSALQDTLQQMLAAIDKTPLTPQQKFHLFRYGVCPKLSWPLLVEELPISWLER